MIDFQTVASFAVIAGILFVIAFLYLVVRYALTKACYKRNLQDIVISKDVIMLRKRILQKESKIQQFPAIYKHVLGINTLFDKHITSLRTVRIYKNRNDELRKVLREEYSKAPQDIRELAQKYASLLKRIYKMNHPFKFFLSEFALNVKVSFILMGIIAQILLNMGFKVLLSPFSDQKRNIRLHRETETLIENSEIGLSV